MAEEVDAELEEIDFKTPPTATYVTALGKMAEEVDAELEEMDFETPPAATYVTASGTELEVTYERGSSPLPYITNEVRYRMRNIPFFVLPPCESKAYDPSRVKAKVDTRNTGYTPPKRPSTSEGTRSKSSSSPTKPRWNTSPLSKSYSGHSNIGDNNGLKIRRTSVHDYSHVKSKISTCWEDNKNNSEEVDMGGKETPRDVGSPRSARKTGEGTPAKAKKRIVTGGWRPDFSHVTAKVDSKRTEIAAETDRRTEVEATDSIGGKQTSPRSTPLKKMEGSGHQNGKLERPSGLKTPPSHRHLLTDSRGDFAASRLPRDSPKHPSSIGTQKSPTKKMPATYAATNSPRNRYANVKAKVDTSDPNPAHKLSRTLSDLTIKEGKQINPRFSSTTSDRTSPRGTPGSVTTKDRQSFSRVKGERETGIKSPFAKERASSELISKEKMPSMKRGIASQNSPFRRREVRAPAVATQKKNTRSADILRDDAREEAGAVIDRGVPKRPLISQAFSEVPDITMEESEEQDLGDVGVCGIEVSNNKTETTVVLKHILALGRQNDNTTKSQSQSSSPTANGLIIVEEDELEFYESEDKVKAPSEIPRSYSLPNLIPRLVVTSEDGELVETVVMDARKLESTGCCIQEKTMKLSSNLGAFEEEDETNMSTYL